MEICKFEIAKKLKEKGFREKCYAYWSGSDNYHTIHYNFIQNPAPSRKLTTKDFYKCENWYCERNNYDAPTISQVLKWLRSQEISVEPLSAPYNDWKCYIKNKGEIVTMISGDKYKTYEQAAIVGIEEVLDNLI